MWSLLSAEGFSTYTLDVEYLLLLVILVLGSWEDNWTKRTGKGDTTTKRSDFGVQFVCGIAVRRAEDFSLPPCI